MHTLHTSKARFEKKSEVMLQQLALVADKTRNGVIIEDSANAIMYVNAGFTAMFGYTEEDLLYRSSVCLFGPAEARVSQTIREGLTSEDSLTIEEIAYGKGGQCLWVAWMSTPVYNDEGKREYVITVITDITDTKLHEVLQRKALEGMARDVPVEEVLSVVCLEVERIIPGVRVRVVGTDRQGRLYPVASPSIPAVMKNLEEIVAGPYSSPCGHAAYYGSTVIEQDVTLSPYPQTVKNMFVKAGLRGCLARAVKAGTGGVLGTVAFYYDAECVPDSFQLNTADVVARICSIALEREASQAAMRRLAYYDPVTGLPNRNLLLASADNLINESMREYPGTSFAVFCINIDRFKRINKSCGYATGNEVLKKVAKLLQELKGATDLVGRVSADEFILVMVGCNAERAISRGKYIQKYLSRLLALDDTTDLMLSACVGVSLYPENGNKAEILFNNAATAMGAAKRKGPGQLQFFNRRLKASGKGSISLEAKLHTAILQGHLRLYYQPQVYMQTGGLFGLEALCRWHDGEAGSISPACFIPLAEESGLIAQLSSWVLKEACRQLGVWRKRGVPVPNVSINLSPTNFRDISLLEKILMCLHAHKLAPADLILELTENVLLDNDPSARTTIKRAHNLGIRLALDDFGTGYSSLSYLRELPFSEIKLDQNFVFDLHKNEVSKRLSQAVLCIGESLGLTSLAEGVETMEQYALLKQQRYEVAQGFLISEPVPADEFEEWLRNWRPVESQDQYSLV